MGAVAELCPAALVAMGLAALQQRRFLAIEERGESVRLAWIAIFLAVLIWSGIEPRDYMTWCLEVAPAVIGGIVLWFTRDRFPLTTLVYVLILIHCIILMVGGHYTYAEVPLGEWAREVLDGSRNNYDKVGHFVQGFIPAMIARELMIRLGVFNSDRWRDFFIVCFCLGFSAFYELIEWWVALLSDEAADAFLGTQGYVWDTQSDMGWALVGSVIALVLLGRLHDRQLRERGFVPAV
jgi:putative membrane protein